jgi:hypothetical protein
MGRTTFTDHIQRKRREKILLRISETNFEEECFHPYTGSSHANEMLHRKKADELET